MPKSTVTAAEARVWLTSDAKRLASLSPEARKTVEPNSEGLFPKGRLHPEAIARHNKRTSAQYVPGATAAAKSNAKAQAVALRAQAAAAGHKVGARGPLPKEFLASLKG